MVREIEEILNFREDISPFLVHLTRNYLVGTTLVKAADALKKIIEQKKLKAGENAISDAKFLIGDEEKEKRFCRAISFTETPLNEVHCLIDISGRTCNLQSYGLVFIKSRLRKKGVSPVLYINNEKNDKKTVVEALCNLTISDPQSAEQILPLIATFGKGLVTDKDIDFHWEREWRYPSAKGDLEFNNKDVFIGICPHTKKFEFEELFDGIPFVDCRRNMKYYAKELVEAKKRYRNFKYSVV